MTCLPLVLLVEVNKFNNVVEVLLTEKVLKSKGFVEQFFTRMKNKQIYLQLKSKSKCLY